MDGERRARRSRSTMSRSRDGEIDDLPAGDYVRISVADTGTRHRARASRPGVRALLHHQAGRQGHRPRPHPDLRLRPPVGRRGHDRLDARRRAPPSRSICRAPLRPPSRPRAGAAPPRRWRSRRRRRRGRRRSWSSRTIPGSAARPSPRSRSSATGRIACASGKRGARHARASSPTSTSSSPT